MLRPIRSLQFKLILTFLIISVAGTLFTTLIVSFSNARAFDDLLREQSQDALVSELLAYYEDNGSWDEVQVSLGAEYLPTGPGQLPDDGPGPFALADENNTIIIPNAEFLPNSIVPAAELANGIVLEVAGRQVGTVLVTDQPPPRDPAEAEFVTQTNQALLIGSLGATIIAVLMAVLLARTLTRPLQELSRASQQMAEGDLNQHVPVRTQDELGELAAAFNQMSAELERVNQARRQMTADIAHDLRTPLTVLSGYLEAMEEGTLAPTPARLALMQQEVQTLQRLVADLRTLSLADTGHLTLQKEPTDIPALLRQVKETFTPQADQQEITLLVEAAADLPLVSLDAARIRQALGNLVGNALRYTPTKGVITMSAAPSANDGIQIVVADTGAGISEADLPHIFNRFYRGDRARQGHGESGLGLAIVQSFVVAHGGRITAASTAGLGTTFTITLPG